MVPVLSFSCITIVPAPALLAVAAIEAVKVLRVGEKLRASTSDDMHPLRTSGTEIACFLKMLAMVTMAPWRGPVSLPHSGRLGEQAGPYRVSPDSPRQSLRPCSAKTERIQQLPLTVPG